MHKVLVGGLVAAAVTAAILALIPTNPCAGRESGSGYFIPPTEPGGSPRVVICLGGYSLEGEVEEPIWKQLLARRILW